jgi:hypothetical protein
MQRSRVRHAGRFANAVWSVQKRHARIVVVRSKKRYEGMSCLNTRAQPANCFGSSSPLKTRTAPSGGVGRFGPKADITSPVQNDNMKPCWSASSTQRATVMLSRKAGADAASCPLSLIGIVLRYAACPAEEAPAVSRFRQVRANSVIQRPARSVIQSQGRQRFGRCVR